MHVYRTRIPNLNTRIRRKMHLVNEYDPYIHHSTEAREAQHEADWVEEDQIPGLQERHDELWQRLHNRDPNYRVLMLGRLAATNPVFCDAVRGYWDVMDTRDSFADLRNTFHVLARLCHYKACLHHLQMDHELRRLATIGVHTTLDNIAPGIGTPEDPVDLQDYITATKDESVGDQAPPALAARLSMPDIPQDDAAMVDTHRRQPFGSDSSCQRPTCDERSAKDSR